MGQGRLFKNVAVINEIPGIMIHLYVSYLKMPFLLLARPCPFLLFKFPALRLTLNLDRNARSRKRSPRIVSFAGVDLPIRHSSLCYDGEAFVKVGRC